MSVERKKVMKKQRRRKENDHRKVNFCGQEAGFKIRWELHITG
jgi:hypothetical protein